MDDSELFTVMRVCAHNLHRMSDGRAGQKRLIGILSENDGITQRELQDIVVVRSGSLSEVLGKLESAGLIERRESPEDRRRVRVYLTGEGKKLARESEGGREGAIGAAFACFSDAEKEQLHALVSRLNQHFEETRLVPRDEEHHHGRDCDRRKEHRGDGRHDEGHHGHGKHHRD